MAREFDDDTIKLVMERLAFELGQRISENAPKDTGTLSKSFLVPQPTIEGNKIIFNPVYYWRFVEFGHVLRNGRFHPPNPFIRRTLHQEAEDAFQRVLDSLD